MEMEKVYTQLQPDFNELAAGYPYLAKLYVFYFLNFNWIIILTYNYIIIIVWKQVNRIRR